MVNAHTLEETDILPHAQAYIHTVYVWRHKHMKKNMHMHAIWLQASTHTICMTGQTEVVIMFWLSDKHWSVLSSQSHWTVVPLLLMKDVRVLTAEFVSAFSISQKYVYIMSFLSCSLLCVCVCVAVCTVCLWLSLSIVLSLCLCFSFFTVFLSPINLFPSVCLVWISHALLRGAVTGDQ